MMVGTSMIMASFGFMVNSISPAYSNSIEDLTSDNHDIMISGPNVANGVVNGDYAYFVDGGYVYRWRMTVGYNYSSSWSKWELP